LIIAEAGCSDNWIRTLEITHAVGQEEKKFESGKQKLEEVENQSSLSATH